MTRRIEPAMALLLRGNLSVTQVCFEVGCSSLGTFSTRFAELVRAAHRCQAGHPTDQESRRAGRCAPLKCAHEHTIDSLGRAFKMTTRGEWRPA